MFNDFLQKCYNLYPELEDSLKTVSGDLFSKNEIKNLLEIFKKNSETNFTTNQENIIKEINEKNVKNLDQFLYEIYRMEKKNNKWEDFKENNLIKIIFQNFKKEELEKKVNNYQTFFNEFSKIKFLYCEKLNLKQYKNFGKIDDNKNIFFEFFKSNFYTKENFHIENFLDKNNNDENEKFFILVKSFLNKNLQMPEKTKENEIISFFEENSEDIINYFEKELKNLNEIEISLELQKFLSAFNIENEFNFDKKFFKEILINFNIENIKSIKFDENIVKVFLYELLEKNMEEKLINNKKRNSIFNNTKIKKEISKKELENSESKNSSVSLKKASTLKLINNINKNDLSEISKKQETKKSLLDENNIDHNDIKKIGTLKDLVKIEILKKNEKEGKIKTFQNLVKETIKNQKEKKIKKKEEKGEKNLEMEKTSEIDSNSEVSKKYEKNKNSKFSNNNGKYISNENLDYSEEEKIETEEEKLKKINITIKKNLKYLFIHYSKFQLIRTTIQDSFDNYNETLKCIKICEFLEFCKDFDLKICKKNIENKQKLIALFKLTCSSFGLSFKNFLNIIHHIAERDKKKESNEKNEINIVNNEKIEINKEKKNMNCKENTKEEVKMEIFYDYLKKKKFDNKKYLEKKKKVYSSFRNVIDRSNTDMLMKMKKKKFAKSELKQKLIIKEKINNKMKKKLTKLRASVLVQNYNERLSKFSKYKDQEMKENKFYHRKNKSLNKNPKLPYIRLKKDKLNSYFERNKLKNQQLSMGNLSWYVLSKMDRNSLKEKFGDQFDPKLFFMYHSKKHPNFIKINKKVLTKSKNYSKKRIK